MPTRVSPLVLAALAVSILAPVMRAQNALLLVSVDGMRPDYVLKADEHGLKIPHLRRMLADGAHASGVRGVLPTVTYPSHTTIVTGVWPIKHGIYSNVVPDPLGKNLDGWYWYAEDIRVPTLWEAASNAGTKTGSVSWPVTVGAKGINYLIPEYWRAQKTPDDLKLMRVISTPGLINEIQKQAGEYIMDLDAAVTGDRQRTKYALAILREKKVQFMMVHLAALDHIEHASGPFSPEANAALEQLDQLVSDLIDAARSVHPNLTVCVLSDHGFTRTDHNLNLLRPFVDAGLVTLNAEHKVTDWKAIPKPDGGSAAVLMKDPHDEATRAKVRDLLHRLAADPQNGIHQVLDAREIAAMGGSPQAAFWVDMKSNFAVIASQAALVEPKKVGGTHGYFPTNPELQASFFLMGPGIKHGLDLGVIDMRSIAPTLADCLGIRFTSGDLKALPVFSGK
ncbi:MAG TPA: ectonucleotide pyrophosphatase/phosphodiesterase [Bryobacteraceae bacterium]|jgi:predicted AlkP superfamily pyrophosphatase or phosphodiesterase